MRASRPCACLICGAFARGEFRICAPTLRARGGTFQRADGTAISIVRHHVDGIIAADPISIQFRLPDGAEVAHTPHIFDAVVRPVKSGVEVYQFRTTWLPIASRVDLFDGYQLKEITSSRRASSLIVHFTGHWVGYVIAGGTCSIFCGLILRPACVAQSRVACCIARAWLYLRRSRRFFPRLRHPCV
jgi:hypothetical protein